MKINVCIVGLGRAGRIHLGSINRLNELELISVVDPNLDPGEASCRKLGIPKVVDFDSALADPGLDAVIVATPTQFHYHHIRQSLEAGKHVFAEKPLGQSISEIDSCYRLAQTNELALHLGFQRRCDPNFHVLKGKISEIGPVRLLKASSRDNPKPPIEYLRISGNIFHDMLIHDFDMLIFQLGLKIPESVYAAGFAYDSQIRDIPDFDTAMVTLKYPDGLICSIDTSRISAYGYDQRIEVFGVEGMAIAQNQHDHTVKVYNSEGTKESPFNYSFPQRYGESYLAELRNFGQSIGQDRQSNVTRDECLLAHSIADAAAESAKDNIVIDFQAFYSAKLASLTQ